MSDDYSKDFEQNEENEKSELNEQQAQANEASTPAEDDAPQVEAERVEPQQQQHGGYNAGQPNYGYNQQQYQYGYQQQQQQPTYQQYQQPYQQYQPPKAPLQTSKGKRGIKVFIACVALVVVFAMVAGVASVVKIAKRGHGYDSDSDSKTKISAEKDNSDADAKLNINASPVSPTETNIEGALTPTQIYAKLKASNVGIVVYSSKSNSAAGEGSGIIMGEDSSGTYTYIITCAHVISDSGVKVKVQTHDGETYDADIVGFDKRTDIGVLRIKATGLKAAEFGDSDALLVGDPVYAIGNPGGVEFFGSFTEGSVSAIHRPVSSEIGYTMKCIQHSAAINPGNSGGMLVNQYGQVIGINSQKIASTEYEGMGFAIPITSAKEIIEDLIAYSYVPNRPMLGITYYPVSASAQYNMIAQIKGLPAGTLIINEISSSSSLANTQAQQYDMIIAVDGKELTKSDILLEKIDNGKVGDKLTLTLCRVRSDYSTETFDVEATLVEDKAGSAAETTTTPTQYVNPFEYFGY